MQPTNILMEEHRVIEIMLAVLQKIVERAAAEGRLDADHARKAVDFIRNFADGCHHGKEEDHLFKMMVERGVPQQTGPVAVMLFEHDAGRRYVKGMDENIDAAAGGDKDALKNYAQNAIGYVNLLKQHIQKEDGILYPLAVDLFSDEDEQTLLQAFNTVETEHMGKGTHGKYLNLVRELAEYYDVPTEAIPKHDSCCAHHEAGK